jgi:nucleoside-diphosphate-sugar epimerase
MMATAKIAITGASGAIGSRLVRAGMARGYSVVALSRQCPDDLPQGTEWRQFDLASPESFAPALAGVDTVVHLASVICGEAPDQQTAASLWAINVLGTQALVTSMKNAGVQRLILGSTANFYAPDRPEANELSPVRPTTRTLYLGSKAVQEWTTAGLADQHGIAFASLRIASVVGTGRSVIDHFARRLVSGDQVMIAGHGSFGADFVHVNDVVDALLIALDKRLEGVWNVSSGQRRLLLDVATDLSTSAGQFPATAIIVEHEGEHDFGFPAINCDKLLAAGYRPMSYPHMIRQLIAEAHSATGRAGVQETDT